MSLTCFHAFAPAIAGRGGGGPGSHAVGGSPGVHAAAAAAATAAGRGGDHDVAVEGQQQMLLLRTLLILTMLDDLDLEDAEAELDAVGEEVDEEAAGADHPAPAALGVVMLSESGRLSVTLESCKRG